MYIKLIQPKMTKRPMDTELKIRMSPPLGLYTIASMFAEWHKVVVENENITPIVWDDAPDVVGITITVNLLPRAIEIARKFRERGSKVVAGGIHITTASETVPENCFDALCIGPAELTWPQIIDDLEHGCLKREYRCKKIFVGEDIVSPAYHLISSADYLYCNIIHTSRGCPFRCDFCYDSSSERVYVLRPVEDVVAEIKAIGRRHIMFIDDNFNGNPRWTRKLLAAIRPLNLRWHCAVSINIAKDTELLDLMRDCGCMGLFIGFESISGGSIDSVHKVQNHIDEYERAIQEIHGRGIMINASFVFGWDEDTPETFSKTLDWIVKNRIETVTSHILTLYPGTKLYEQMRAAGRIVSEDLALYDTAHVVYTPRNLTAEELYKGYLWIYKKLYSWRNILRRVPKSRRQIPSYLLFNIFYRKYGRFTEWLCRFLTYERIGKIADRSVISNCLH